MKFPRNRVLAGRVSTARATATAILLAMMLMGGATVAAADTIKQVRVEGTQRIEPATVMSYIDVQSGDPFDANRLDRALKNLYATGLFADVSLYQEGSDLIVVVVENPIVNDINFEGNDKLKDDVLLSEIQIRPRTVFTRSRVQSDVERLQEVYRLSGRFSAQIEPKIIKLDQNRVNLVFEISEGPQTLISRISFIGNTKFDDADLQRVVRSKEDRWWRFFTSDDKYDPDRLAYDRELLRKFYLDQGYADFRVENAVAELSPDRKDFFVTFTLEEGERYKVGGVHIASNLPDLDADLLKPSLTFAPGQWYNASEIEKSVQGMTDALGNLQYAFVDVRPEVTRNREQKTIDIKFTVNESQKTFVNNVNISGNVRTLDEVIRREMDLVEGDAYNTAKLKKSEQRIRDLGFFETVQVKPVQTTTPDRTDIDIAVAEKSTGELSIGAGFSTSDGPLGDFRIRERNFLGKGQKLELATTISGRRNEVDFSFVEPYFLKRDLSAGIDLFHVTRDLQEESSYDSRRTGTALSLGYPLSEKLRQTLSYRFDVTDITNIDSNASLYIQQQEGERSTSAIGQKLVYDATNSRLEPTEGYNLRLENEVAGLGGDADYLRTKVGAAYYYPIVDKWILNLMGEAGYIFGLKDDDVRINERFYIGGSTLRGFEDGGIGPRDAATDDALGGNRFYRGTVELSFPSGLPDDLGVRLHTFSDFGSLSELDQSGAGILDDNAIRASIGGGLTWRSPMGPVRIDLATPVKKQDYDQTEVFRFSFGTRF
jgi:outer membrane protein insertion porin family